MKPAQLSQSRWGNGMDAIWERLEIHGARAVHFLQLHAVIGETASIQAICRLGGFSHQQGYSLLEKLLAAEVLDFDTAGISSFIDRNLYASLYEAIPIRIRMTLHDRYAKYLTDHHASAEVIAVHIVAGVPTNDIAMLKTLATAARHELLNGAPRVALRYLQTAAQWTTDDDLRALLMIDLGLVQAACGDQSALERLETALRVITGPSAHQRALHALAMTLYRYGRHQDSAKLFRSGLTASARAGTAEYDFLGGFICAAQYLPELREEVKELLQAHLALTDSVPRSLREFTLLSNIALTRSMSVLEFTAPDVAELADRALNFYALPTGDSPADLSVLLVILALLWAGQPLRADAYINMVLEYARSSNSQLLISEASMVKSLIAYALGDSAEAIHYAERSIEGIEDGWGSALPVPHSILAQSLLDQGRFSEARKTLEDINARVLDNAMRGMNAWYFLARGRVRLAAADAQGAASDFEAAGRVFDEYLWPTSPALLPWRSFAAMAYIQMGNPEKARDLAVEELKLAKRACLPIQIGVALRAQALTEGDFAVRVETLRTSVRILESTAARLEILRSKIELAKALISHPDHATQGDEILRETHAAALNSGQYYIAGLARQLWIESGEGHTAASARLAELTKAESKVLDLFVNEDSDIRKISQKLYISPNTVEWHLKRIRKKLGLNSRDELRQFLKN